MQDVVFDVNGHLVDDDNALFVETILQCDYAQRTRLEKPVVVFELVEDWKRGGGRFLQQQVDDLVELADKTAREYVGRRLRRMNHGSRDVGSGVVPKASLRKVAAASSANQRSISTQLDYARDGVLYGRDAEQAVLQDALHLAAQQIQMVVISGPSGVGKTALAHSILQKSNEDAILFAQGTFEQPFHIPVVETSLNTALVDAMTTLLHQLTITERHREVILEMVDPSVFQSVFPAFASILDVSETSSSDNSSHGVSDNTHGKQGGKLQVLVMASLLKMIAMVEQGTIVLQIDHLQWADEASLGVLTDMLAMIADIPRILLLFTDRDESSDTALSLKKKRLLDSSKENIHCIHLKALSETDVTSLLSGLLQTDEAKVESISHFFFTKTDGNAAFVCELLRKCQEEDALLFHEASNQWRINDAFVSLVISDFDNMVDLFSSKVQALPETELLLLQSASCLGSNLDESILQIAVQLNQPLKLALDKSNSQRLVVYNHHRFMYGFAHDGIHHAVYNLLGEEERAALHLRLGKRIFNHLEKQGPDKSERLIDIGLSQLIRGSGQLKSHSERVDVAKLCLEVGQRAFSVQGFHSTDAFLQHAISLLGPQKWQTDYNLCIQLHNIAAEVAYCTGKQAVVQEVVDEVLGNVLCFEDSLSVRATNVYSLGSKGSTQEAIEQGLETLKKLGVNIPINPSTYDLLRSNWCSRRIHKVSDSDILCLPFMQDTRKIAAMQFMNLLMFNAWKFNPKLMSVIIQKMVLLTLDGGLTSASAPAFGWGGKDIETGYRFGKLSLQVYDQFRTDSWLARVTVAFYGVVSSWKDPAAISLDSLKSAYQIGIGTGDIEYAVGLALFILPLHQMVKNFMAPYHENITTLNGEILTDREAMILQFQGTALAHWVYLHELILAYFFQQFDTAERLCSEIEPMLQYFYGAMDSSLVAFYHCLALLSKRPTGKNKRVVKLLLNKIRRWALHAPVNFLVKQFLLEAELARVEGNRLVAVAKYGSAILHAKETKFLMVEGLANERAGRFHLEQRDLQSATQHLQTAVDLYKTWGGVGKVDHLIAEMGRKDICLS